MFSKDLKLKSLLGLFVGLLIGMNLLGVKIIPFFGLSVSVGIFMVPFAFLITDVVSEVYGAKVARQFLFVGISALAMILIYASIFVILPPHDRYPFNVDYKNVFGASIRIMIASMVALTLSQLHDIWAFEYWKKRTNGRFLWLRNNLSTMVSQGIDTLVFMFIAFYMVTPQFTAMFIIQLIIPFYMFKILFAMLDTPLVYLGVRWLKKGK